MSLRQLTWLFVSSPSIKPSYSLQSRSLCLITFLILILTAGSSSSASGQPVNGRVIVFPITIQCFQDVFFDGPVAGNPYKVSNLPPGSYYWRVAPADSPLGAFSHPVRFFLSGGAITSVQPRKRAVGSR